MIFARDSVQDFVQQFFRVAAGDARGRGLDRDAARAHQFGFETVGAQFFANLLENRELPGVQLDDQRNQQALSAEFAFAPRAQVLFEKHALVRHVLVNDPQSFAIHCDDEAAVHLAQRLQVGDVFDAWQRSGRGGGAASPFGSAVTSMMGGVFPGVPKEKSDAVEDRIADAAKSGGPARRVNSKRSAAPVTSPNEVGITARGGP